MSPLVTEEPTDLSETWDAPAGACCSLLKMKYIRHRKLGFILFEGTVRHDELAHCLGDRADIVSAGFVFTPATDFRCLGTSESLNVGVGPTDGTDLRQRIRAF